MATVKKTYQHRDNKPFTKTPWYKRLTNALERTNKILTLRLLGALLRTRHISAPIPLEEVSSVLFIRYDALGDMIVTTPLWRILKRLKPDIKIGVAGSFKNLDVLRADPDIDFCYDYTASSLTDFFTLSKKTREQKWDIVFSCSFNQKTRNAIICRLASKHGITATVGTANKEGHQALFSRLVALPATDRPLPMTSQLQYLLRSTIALPLDSDERPSLMIDPETERETVIRLTATLSELAKPKYIVINTDAQPKNKWGETNSILLAEYITSRFQEYAVLLTSMPANRDAIETIIGDQILTAVRYFPTTDLHELITLVRHASIVVTPDTSVAHIASAEHKPLVGFYFGVSEWLPFRTQGYIITPVVGQPISTIPLGVVKDVVDSILRNLDGNTEDDTRVVRCERPEEQEVLLLEPTFAPTNVR